MASVLIGPRPPQRERLAAVVPLCPFLAVPFPVPVAAVLFLPVLFLPVLFMPGAFAAGRPPAPAVTAEVAASTPAARPALGSDRAAASARQATAPATGRQHAMARSTSTPRCRSLLLPMLCATATGQIA
jgi:hypothetical protein